MIEHINTIAQSWWNWMWPMFWQVSVLVVFIGAVDLLLRRRIWPQVRYALWLLVLVKLILPPTYSLSTSVVSQVRMLASRTVSQLSDTDMPADLPAVRPGLEITPLAIDGSIEQAPDRNGMMSSKAAESAGRVFSAGVAASIGRVGLHWKACAMAVWLAGVIVLGSWATVRFRKLRQLHSGKSSDAKLPEWFGALLTQTAKKLGLRKLPGVVLSRNIASPAVFGTFRSVLVLPADTIRHLSQKRTEHILLHELAHIKRGDLKVNSFYMLLQIVYWFNPLLWLLRRRLQHLRELCCDATVAGILRDKTTDYRETILQNAKWLLTGPARSGIGLLGLAEDSHNLLARLKWLEKKTWKYHSIRLVTIFAVVAVMLACVLPMAKAGNSGVLRVAADGSAKYSSIQEAIDAADTGAVIRIGPGVYEERLRIDKPLTLAGSGWNQTTVMTRSAGADVFEEALRSITIQMREAETDEQRKAIEAKFKTEFKEKYGMPTLLVSDTKGVVICDLKLTSPGRRLEGRTMSVPIIEFSNAKVTVSKCVVIGTPGDGIHILDGSDVEIRDSLVAAVWSTGIVIGERQGAGSSVRLLDSELRNCHYAGIRIREGNDSARVERCRISGAAWHGIRYDNVSPTVVGNMIFGNARCGIYASGKTAATVRQNLFYANEMVGMSCWFQNRDTIEGNTFADNKRSGLEVMGASKPTVRKNIFFANPTGVSCGDIASDSASAKSDGVVTLEENIFWKNKAATKKTSQPESMKVLQVDPLFTSEEKRVFSLRAGSPARRSGIGVADPIGFKSPWPIQPEETAIIPEGQTRDSREWKKQVQSKPSAKRPATSRKNEAASIDPSDIALLYYSEPDVRIETIKKLAASNDSGLIDDLIRAHSVENYTPVHNEYGRVLRSLTRNRNVRGKGAWKSWLANEVKVGRLKNEYLPINPDSNHQSKILSFALKGPDDFDEMATALTAEIYDRQKCHDALRYMVFNDHLPEVQKFLSGNWLHRLFSHKNININDIGYFLNGLANPGHLREQINNQVSNSLDSDNPIVVANALNLIAGVKGFSTRFTVPEVESKVEALLSSSVPEVAVQTKRAIERIRPSEKRQVTSEASKVVSGTRSVLQQLIDSTPAGQIVRIPKGVYTEPVTVTKPLTLKGESRNDCILEVTSNLPAISVDTKGKGRVIIEAVTIKWQLATSDRTKYPFAVMVKDTIAEVKNCSFLPLGNFKRCPVAINAMGFSELGIDTCRFEGFEFTVCFGEGTKGTIRNSLVMGSGHQGISLYSGATAEIIGNIVTGSRYHAVRSTGGTLNMTNNLIINNANRGVYLGNKSARGTIANNVIIGNGTGIGGFARSNVKVENNIIADSSYAGIGFRDSCSLSIRDNIFRGNERGWILFKEGSRNGNTVYKNTFWQNKVDAENMNKTADSIITDPGFIDAEKGDFSLKSGPALQQKQGLTNPEIFKKLWKIWKNREEKNVPATGN